MSSKPRFVYNKNDMVKAIDAVKSGKMNPFKASIDFNVPRSTLRKILNGKTTIDVKMGPSPTLNIQYEELLVNWIIAIAKKGFPIIKYDLLTSVSKLVKDLNIPNKFVNGRPGKKWMNLFLKRHPEIAERTVEKLTKSRALVSEVNIRNWFSQIEEYFAQENVLEILKDPKHIYNCDESGFMLCPDGQKVLCMKGERNVYEICDNNEKMSITVLIMVSATSSMAPPMLVFPGKRLPSGISNTICKDWTIARSDKGWITGEVFFEYIVNYFHPWLIEKKVPLPVALFLDGHVSHLTYHLSKFCADNGIYILALYPNATHILQPLDVSVFGPLKKEWAKEVHQWRMNNSGMSLMKKDFAPMLENVINNRLKKETIINGFRTCGLFPWSSDSVDYTKCRTFQNVGTNIGANTCNNNPNINYFEGNEYLELLLGAEKVSNFKNLELNVAELDDEDKAMYKLWSRSQDLLQSTGAIITTNDICQNEHTIINENTAPLKDIPDIHVRSNEVPSHSVVPSSTEKRQNDLANAISPKDQGLSVTSPFKRNLLWPKSPQKTGKCRRRLRLPAVVTSKEFQDYEEEK